MQSSPRHARAQEDPGCMLALLLTGGLRQIFILFSQTAHLRLRWCSSLREVPWTTSPRRDSLLPWWLRAVLEQRWEFVAPIYTVQSICPTSAPLGSRVPTSCSCLLIQTRVPLSPGSAQLQCLHRLAVLLLWAFPLAWQVTADGHWCHVGLWVFSCCP